MQRLAKVLQTQLESGAPSMVDTEKSGYSVGFKRTPKHTRFKKGKSGNPRGRPKGALNVATILRKALAAPVKVIKR
jgi:hypothetical protein